MWVDVIFKNGKVVDGTGNPWFHADVAVKDGRIHKIFRQNSVKASKVIDAEELIVAPGFIDIHNHSDISMIMDPKMDSKVRQGITTEVNGQCGGSPAPVNENTLKHVRRIKPEDIDWTTMDGYFNRLEQQGISQNAITMVGHGTVRYYVMGDEPRISTPVELEHMKKLVRKAMEDGAVGLSTGLAYAPGCWAHTDEIVELAKVVSEFKGFYASHLRESCSKVLGWSGEQGSHFLSVVEAIDIGRRSGVSAVQLSHVCGQNPFLDDTELYLKVHDLIDSAREEGINVTADILPNAWGSVAPWPARSIFAPSELAEGKEAIIEKLSDPETRAEIKQDMLTRRPSSMDYVNTTMRLLCMRGGQGFAIRIFPPFKGHLKNPEYEYKTLDEIAAMKKKDLFDSLFDLIVDNEGDFSICHLVMDHDLTMSQLTWSTTMPSTDGGDIEKPGELATKRVRPTAYAGFPAALAWVRENKMLPLEEMVKKMTSFPANTVGLNDRGLLKEGFWADVTVFDPVTIDSECTYENDARPEYPIGVPYVMVNGQLVVEDSEHTGELPGKVLRSPF
jgi:N-acyl-D-aspartate/D-glutamate deacylase